MTKIAVVYYSSTGHTYQVAQAAVEGARSVGADVRLRKVRELAPPEAIGGNPRWKAHLDATKDVELASLDDLTWADGYIFGTPTRFGLPAAQLKQFLDSAGGVWAKGLLANKPAAAFTGAQNPHGGQESTILALSNLFYHWGAVMVPVGYTDSTVFAAGGNPYGVSYTDDQPKVREEILEAGRYLGRRVARYAEIIAANRGWLAAAATPDKHKKQAA